MSDDLVRRLEEPHKRNNETRYQAAKRHIALRMEAADLIRELKAELAFYKGFHDGVCKDGTHVIVPVEPTPEMLQEGLKRKNGYTPYSVEIANIYRAMIRAAQPGASD